MELSEVGKISPEKALEIMKKKGLAVSLDQAKLILDFLYKMANIAVSQYFFKPK